MPGAITRWSKNGGPAQSLPDVDRDPDGGTWTDLANNAAGRTACGWAALASVPDEVDRAAARIALHRAGLLTAIDAFVAAHADPEVRIIWAERPTLRRDSALLMEAADEFGMTDEQIDDLFIAAGDLP